MPKLASTPAVPIRAALGALLLLVAIWAGRQVGHAVHAIRPGTELQYDVRVPHGPGIDVARFWSNLLDGERAQLKLLGIQPIRVEQLGDQAMVIDLPAMSPCELRHARSVLKAYVTHERAIIPFKL